MLWAMQSWADREHERLNQIHGDGWDVWYVPTFPVGCTWHAKPKGTPIATIHADSTGDLEEQIKQQQSGSPNGLPH